MGYTMDTQQSVVDTLTGMMIDADLSLPRTGQVKQTQITQDPAIVAQHFQSYWDQFWTRDSPEHIEDPEHWQDFIRILDQFPDHDPLQIQLLDVSLWRTALAKTKSHTARGFDGWFVDELKSNSRNSKP